MNCPGDKGIHCCYDMNLALNWQGLPVGFDPGDDSYVGHYVLCRDGTGDGASINFCPFCGAVLPGAYVTDWELHDKCERCHWTGPRDSDMMPSCICSRDYEELKRIQDETNQSN
jgi:hypothetical protein